ncbi:hypothetical protein DL767_001119 [Monosporascus sp. MG133]|nr:hypothetical protein DL767_001119 [Monosporascus sp. MG133]
MEHLHLSLQQIAASSILLALLPCIFRDPESDGPVVRIRPHWVDTMNPEDTLTIYRAKNEFKKSEAYRVSPDIIPLDLFNVQDVDVHRRWRRLLSSPLSEGGLKEVLPQVEANVRLAIKQIGQEMKVKGAADIYKWWMCMTTDVIGELTFGESFRMLQTGKHILDIEAQSLAGAIVSALPSIGKVPSVLLPHSLVDTIEAIFRVNTRAETLLEKYRARLDNAPPPPPTLFTKIIKAADDDTLSPSELRDNARLYIVAGSDTTSNTLTYLVWQTCRHPAVKKKLVKEATSLPDNFTTQQLKDLPYLNLVISETLRLHSAAPAGLSRAVPPEGATIGGYSLPGGTVVVSQAWSLHRNPDVFPEPDDFKPERWENPSKRMKDAFHPFGGGSRSTGLIYRRPELSPPTEAMALGPKLGIPQCSTLSTIRPTSSPCIKNNNEDITMAPEFRESQSGVVPMTFYAKAQSVKPPLVTNDDAFSEMSPPHRLTLCLGPQDVQLTPPQSAE